jgi:hypothetical protein
MRKYFLLVCVMGIILSAQSQPTIRESWVEKPVLHSIDNKLINESAVIILDKRRVEYIDEKQEVVQYKTLHKIIHIIDDKGIESFNRVYLPVSNTADIVDIRARTILPGGKIIEVSKENIKDLKEEDDRVYKIFAMEGLEKGCEVEYYYTFKKHTSFFGTEVFQGRTPVMEASLHVVAPKRLTFEMKPYNSSIKPLDSTVNEQRWITVSERNIPAAENEKYCAFEANLKRFEYKLAYNTSRTSNDRLLTWDELAKRVYANYTTYSNKELKKVDDLLGDMKIKNIADETAKVVAAENYIKTNFAAREDIDGEDASDLEKVVKTKLASHLGILRLYGAVFRQLNIQHEFVLAGDRKKHAIDKSFENWNNCENPVIYFPGLKKYMAPTLAHYRFPWVDPNWANANAFFIKSTTIGNFTTAYAEVKTLPLEDYIKTVINTKADVQLNKGLDTLLVSISQIYSGYAASPYKSIFTFSPEENKKLITKEMIKFGTKSENLVSSTMENSDFESYHDNKPFILSATVKASELVEKAGNKTIIKIGDIIGEQVEMYQEKPRQFPMEIEFPHVLERKINLTIPDGYTVKNLDDLKINHTYQDKGQTTMGFISSYELEGNVVKISILEEYRRTNYPLLQFEDFKKVINAAADFNKVALVLEKK